MATYPDFPFALNGGFNDRKKQKIAQIAATTALNHFDDSFKNQGFADQTTQKWERTRKGRGRTLIDTGRLRRSGRKRTVSFKKSIIDYPIVYAAVHNDGLRAGRGRGFQMPKRQFVGRSRVLDKRTKMDIFRILKQTVFK